MLSSSPQLSGQARKREVRPSMLSAERLSRVSAVSGVAITRSTAPALSRRSGPCGAVRHLHSEAAVPGQLMSQSSPLVQLAGRREQERAASLTETAEKPGQSGRSVRRDRGRRGHQVVPSGGGRGGVPGTRILWIPAESFERRGKRRLEMEVLEGRQRVSAGQMH